MPAAGIIIGYARVFTRDQKLDSQLDELRRRGCRRIFADNLSGKNADRADHRGLPFPAIAGPGAPLDRH